MFNNQASFGYLILAAEKAGLNEDEIKKIVKKMHRAHDEVSVEKAAEYYRKSDY